MDWKIEAFLLFLLLVKGFWLFMWHFPYFFDDLKKKRDEKRKSN